MSSSLSNRFKVSTTIQQTSQILAAIQDFPIKEGCSSVNLSAVSQPVSRSDVKNGLVKVADLDDLDEDGALRWMFA